MDQWKSMPQSYIFENPFFMGTGVDVNMRFSDVYKIKMLEVLHQRIEDGGNITAPIFKDELFPAMRMVELWQKQQLRQFGKVAEEHAGILRVD